MHMDREVYKIVLAGRRGTGKTEIFEALQQQTANSTETVTNRTSSRYERGIWTARMNSRASQVTVRYSLSGRLPGVWVYPGE